MDDLSDQLARRDRLRRKLDWAKTPEQRMEEMMRLQGAMDAAMRRNPAGYSHFLRRNFKKRAIPIESDRGR